MWPQSQTVNKQVNRQPWFGFTALRLLHCRWYLECRDFSVAPVDMKWWVSLSWQLHLVRTYLSTRCPRVGLWDYSHKHTSRSSEVGFGSSILNHGGNFISASTGLHSGCPSKCLWEICASNLVNNNVTTDFSILAVVACVIYRVAVTPSYPYTCPDSTGVVLLRYCRQAFA